MSQFDFGTIDPNTKSGAQLALDLNNFRDALNTLNKGSVRPAYAQPGMLWVREVSSTQWDLCLFDGDTDYTLRSINPTTNVLLQIPSTQISGLGPAAAASITISTTDSTAGRLTRNADWGIGGTAAAPALGDFKSLSPGGIYRGAFNTTANGPISTSAIFSAIATWASSTVILWEVLTSNTQYFGFYNSGTGSITWYEVYSKGNVGAFMQTLLPAATQADAKTTLGIVDSLGIGQTWQDVTGSRVLGTTYTNNTGRPISISGYVNNSSGGRISIVVGGVVIWNMQAASGVPPMPFSAVIPIGATYAVTLATGSGTLALWAELR